MHAHNGRVRLTYGQRRRHELDELGLAREAHGVEDWQRRSVTAEEEANQETAGDAGRIGRSQRSSWNSRSICLLNDL